MWNHKQEKKIITKSTRTWHDPVDTKCHIVCAAIGDGRFNCVFLGFIRKHVLYGPFSHHSGRETSNWLVKHVHMVKRTPLFVCCARLLLFHHSSSHYALPLDRHMLHVLCALDGIVWFSFAYSRFSLNPYCPYRICFSFYFKWPVTCINFCY